MTAIFAEDSGLRSGRAAGTVAGATGMTDSSQFPVRPALRPCEYQVAGHLFEEGKAGSLVDDFGQFYKPLQAGPRGARELEFYTRAFTTPASKKRASREEDDRDGLRKLGAPARTSRNKLLQFVPRFLGTVEFDGRDFIVLEDVAVPYSKPCVIDIKIGFQTWYSSADENYVRRARAKDAATTQAALGFKICGWQVYKHNSGRFWRASKSWCKTMSQAQVCDAMFCFADNEAGLTASKVYGGCFGAVAQLRELESWFRHQREFHFYSSSVLILYEGDAACVEDSNVRVRLVDFAHTFTSDGKRDENFLGGLASLICWLEDVVRKQEEGQAARCGHCSMQQVEQ